MSYRSVASLNSGLLCQNLAISRMSSFPRSSSSQSRSQVMET